jgi:hypothetical protein
MLFFYPLVLLSSYRAYRRAVRKNESIPTPVKKKAFWEILKLQVNPKVLIDAHLFVEFQKYCELDEVAQKTNLYRKHQATDFQT